LQPQPRLGWYWQVPLGPSDCIRLLAMEGAKSVEDLQFEKAPLGRGYFGEVWRAQLKKSGQPLAVKRVPLRLINENHLMDQLKREIHILYALQHPHIVRLHFNFEDDKYMYLGMEFCPGGSLFDKLQKQEKFKSPVAARYFRETCEALDYLHHLPDKVIHRDIKPENILLDALDSVKLADFGWANLLEADKRDTFCGTLDYLAPEMIKGTGHDESVDMWTMGVLLYELLTGQSPFGSTSKETTCKRIIQVDLFFPEAMDMDGRDLISKLCRKDPKERLKVREALAHNFLRHPGQAGPDASGYPADAPAVPAGPTKGVTEGEDDLSPSRPSVVARQLRSKHASLMAEKDIAVQALQKTEGQLRSTKEALDRAEAEIKQVRQERQELEAKKKEMEKRCGERASKIEGMKRRAERKTWNPFTRSKTSV